MGPHYYDSLDLTDFLKAELPLWKVAEQIESMNYGTQRFLSHLVDVRREILAKRIREYKDRGHHDIADNVMKEGDKLADGIEALLKLGLF